MVLSTSSVTSNIKVSDVDFTLLSDSRNGELSVVRGANVLALFEDVKAHSAQIPLLVLKAHCTLLVQKQPKVGKMKSYNTSCKKQRKIK